MYLRSKLKLTFHSILSSVSFIIHLLCVTKQLAYVCNFQFKTLVFKKKCKRIHFYSRWAYKWGGLIYGWAYIQNNIFVSKWMGLYLGGLKVGFYSMVPEMWHIFPHGNQYLVLCLHCIYKHQAIALSGSFCSHTYKLL